MGRKRYLSTDVSTDARVRRLAEKSEFAALLYTWMIPHAGDDALITADPDELLMMVVPGFRWRTSADIAAATDQMVELGLLIRESGQFRFPEDAFYKYQAYIKADRRSAPSQHESAHFQEVPGNAQEVAQIRASSPVSSPVTPSSSDPVSSSGSSSPASPPPTKRARARTTTGQADERTDEKRATNGHEPTTSGRRPRPRPVHDPPVCWKCAADLDNHAVQSHRGPCEFEPPLPVPPRRGQGSPKKP